ncbi:MAG: pyruvate kinase [Phycisphaerales bacterium JB040]
MEGAPASTLQTLAGDAHRQLTGLLHTLEQADIASTLRSVPPGRRPSAENLLRYVHLRRHDLRELQKLLAQLGLSSLGRLEPAVHDTLARVTHAAARLLDPPAAGPDYTPRHPTLPEGRALLDRNTDALLGPRPHARAVRVMLTMPTQAADDPAFLVDALERGLDAVRINTAHDTPEHWNRFLEHLRAAERSTSHSARVFVDLAGPKIRTASIVRDARPKKKARLHVGDTLTLHARDPAPDTPPTGTHVWTDAPEAIARLRPGDAVCFDDGKITTTVLETRPGAFDLRVTRAKPDGQNLRTARGVNLPGVDTGLPVLTDSDLRALDALAPHADAFCCSFIRTPDDVHTLLDAIRTRTRRPVGVVVKIETRQGFQNIAGILLALLHAPGAGVMIARGDLAVEVGFARLAEVQEEILWLAEAAHMPVIWATEVLSALAKTGLPARAEVTDAAMAQRAECVMLNKGPHILEALSHLTDILERMQGHQRKKMATLRPLAIASIEARLAQAGPHPAAQNQKPDHHALDPQIQQTPAN